MFEELTVLLRISIWFSCQFAGFHVANRAVIDVCYYCADVWSVLAHFGSKYSRARPSTGRSGQVDSVFISHFSWRDRWPISCSGSAVSVAAPARLRLKHLLTNDKGRLAPLMQADILPRWTSTLLGRQMPYWCSIDSAVHAMVCYSTIGFCQSAISDDCKSASGQVTV